MLAPHLNPRIDAHLRFRLALQVSNVRHVAEDAHSVWELGHFPSEVRRMRERYPYGWQVAGTTVGNLFREHGVPWDDEDEEKAAAGHVRQTTREDRAFWRAWRRPPVMRPANELPADLRRLILSFVPKPKNPKPEPEEESTYDVERKLTPWWMDPRAYGDF